MAVDASGRVAEGDPRGTGQWTLQQTGAKSLPGLACPSALECVAIDAPGDALTATSGPLPLVPGRISRPGVRGVAQQGRELVVSNGAWSNGPTSYVYEWHRCTASGRRCHTLGDAVEQRYTVTRSDVGHRIGALVWAYNITGAGAPQVSPVTGVVLPGAVRQASKTRGCR